MKVSYTTYVRDDISLDRCVGRLLQIKAPLDEIIVCDRGSTSPIMGSTYRFLSRTFLVKIIYLDESDTIAAARNAAAKLATGDIIVSMDPDVILPYDVRQVLERVFADRKTQAAICPVYVYPWLETTANNFFLTLLNLRFRLSVVVSRFLRPIPFKWASQLFPCGRGEFQAFRTTAFQRVKGYAEGMYSGEDCDIVRRVAEMFGLGSVVWINSLRVWEASDRYRKMGHLGVFWLWIGNSLKIALGLPIRYPHVPKT